MLYDGFIMLLSSTSTRSKAEPDSNADQNKYNNNYNDTTGNVGGGFEVVRFLIGADALKTDPVYFYD